MPTYETTPRFITDLERLTSEQRTCFRRAVTAFVHDLRTGGHFRAGLRVKRVQRAVGVYELTWSMGSGPRDVPPGSTDPSAVPAPHT